MFTCRQCGAEFTSRSDLARHQAEERRELANMQDDNPTDSDNAAFRDAAKGTAPKAVVAPKVNPQAAPVAPVVPVSTAEPPAKAPKAPKAPAMPVIPWAVPGVDPELRALSSTTPIRFEGQAYARQDGLHPFEVRTMRRQRDSRRR